ncbi:PAS domain-containing protein [Adhaeribacter radiodurans]|uniref:histidine kinase n=1 Tax=Adhaeribacter radiodurans TaxID=2745197 RepID=A0A7L7L1C1_9BACT|nr:PAS domain-containing protein [Adhaeribacter radiodurans]QMU26588.1 PAS domain-containing protein [Adhaeribacter radiodurans]
MSDLYSPPPNLLAVFNSLPGAYLLLSRDLIMEAVSDAYLEATLTKREDLVGHHIFELFPDNPEAPEAKGKTNVRASLEQVIATGKPHELARQQYDVPDPEKAGHFVERHWLTRNIPVLDAQGQVYQIIHSVVNVTAAVLAEKKLSQSESREKAAHAQADLQEQQLHNILMQAPALICIFQGPEHVFKFVNPPYQQLVGERPLVGKPIAEVMPELVGQPIFGLLHKVYRTGETYYANEMLVQLDHENTGQELGENYYNFIYQATRNLAGEVDGIIVFAYEVTAQVAARRQVDISRQEVQTLNKELQAINEELQVTNQELTSTNQKLEKAQHALKQLNQVLEARVDDRTLALHAALQKTELQREQLREQQNKLQLILGQVPAAIATLEGPEHRYNFFNDPYLALSGDRAQLGLTVTEVFPELAEQGFVSLLDQVYATGFPFVGTEKSLRLYDPNTGKLKQRYVDFVYQPLRNDFGQIQGILAFIVDVTEKVEARQQAAALQAELIANAQKLIQERETFYQVFELTPAAICIQRGPEHRYEYVNAAYQAFFPGRELLGRTVAEALPETVPAGFAGLLNKVYQTGETYFGQEAPLLLEQPDGKPPREMYFTFTYQAYRENGQIVGISTFAYDVTQQVQMRQQQEAQQKQLQVLFEQAPVAIAVLRNPEYVIEVANPLVAALWGRIPEQVLGKALLEALPEVRDQGFKELLDEVVRTGTPFVANEVTAMLPRNGQLEKIYLNFVYQPLQDEQGQVMSVAAVATDVSEQVKARQASEASTQQLRLITDSLPVLIGYLDQEEKYRFANKAYESWFHQKPEDLLNRPVRQVVGETAYRGVKQYIDRALKGERLDFEATMPYREGFTKHIRTSYVPDLQNEKVVGFYTLVQDITDQVEARRIVEASERKATALAENLLTANQELQEANQQLVRVNVDLDNFIYTASHDLKAPILNIEGLMEALSDQLPPDSLQTEDVPYTLHLIQDSVQRFKRTIDHLTEITKLQKENKAEVTPVDLAAIISDVQLDLATLIQTTQAQIEVDVRNCPTIRFSAKNLRSIIYNLLSNAIKYHSPKRTPLIQIYCTGTAEYQVLTVADNGLGMDLSGKNKLFTMFKRLHNHVEGSGIGLYMVKKIIENAGGKIEVTSNVEEGSTFQVYFRR